MLLDNSNKKEKRKREDTEEAGESSTQGFPENPTNREDSTFDWLRNLDNLNAFSCAGTFVFLPDLQFHPKGFNEEKSCFISTQLCKTLLDVVNIVRKDKIPSTENGIVISGPHGIGKSYTTYLIAAYAYVNSYPLLYIPICAKWVGFNSDNRRAKFWLHSFQSLNRGVADNIQLPHKDTAADTYGLSGFSGNSLADMVEYGLTYVEHGHAIQQYVMMILSEYKEKPVFYILDEHNELFEDNVSNESYFMPWKKWTANTHGFRTFTVYCGSAHSKFEHNLPSGMQGRVCPMQPLTFNEFELFVTLDKTPFKINDKCNIEKYAILTGCSPREILHLSQFNWNETKYYNYQYKHFSAKAKSFFSRQISKMEQFDFFELLEKLFLRGGRDQLIRVTGSVYDKGFLYMDDDGVYRFLCMPAEAALMKIFANHMEVSPIDSNWEGKNFELWMAKVELKGPITFRGFSVSPYTNEMSEIHYTVQRTIGIKKNKYPRNLYNECIMYIPEVSNFPYIDYVIDDPTVGTIFKQITLTNDLLYGHIYGGNNKNVDYGEVGKLFGITKETSCGRDGRDGRNIFVNANEEPQFSERALLAEMLTGIRGSKNGVGYKCRIKLDGSFEIIDPDGIEVKNVYIVYVFAQEEEILKDHVKVVKNRQDLPPYISLPQLRIYGKETVMKHGVLYLK